MRFTAWAVLLATLLLWSGNWIVARAVRADIAPGVATAGRLLIVALVLAPFVWRGLAAKLPALRRRDWGVLWLLGFSGGGIHLSLQWLGLHYTTATSATLYLSTAPLELPEYIALICLLGLVFMTPWGEAPGRGPRWYHFAGISLILAGVALSTWRRR